MKNRLLSLLLAVLMVLSLMTSALAAQTLQPLEGKVVILHSNDVHGVIDGYATIAALRDQYEAEGAEVILADCGDYAHGSAYVNLSGGANAVELMNLAGYDVAVPGSQEFVYGYDHLVSLLENAQFTTICCSALRDGEPVFDGWTVIEKAGVKIGFVGVTTPETAASVSPSLIQGLSFTQQEALYDSVQRSIDAVRDAGADVVVGLFHLGVDSESLGNRSVDVWQNTTGLDFILDGHSHTVMTPGDFGEFSQLPIQSTGAQFANVGVVVIDPDTKQITDFDLIACEEITVPEDSAVLARATEIERGVDAAYTTPFARSDVELNGVKAPNGNRDSETNLGDLITDAMRWAAMRDNTLKVPEENVVAITNGGGIRAWIHAGDVSMKNVNTVLPFGNTVAVVYVTGAALLEALEASCFCAPSPIGGFPQVSGVSMMVDTSREYDQGDPYPDSVYCRPKSIQRVEIFNVNGKPFDPDAVYAVVTNNFCAAGGDTYYALKAASDRFDTSIPLDEALIAYIADELGGVIGEAYAEPQGRLVFSDPITITDQPQDVSGTVGQKVQFFISASGMGLTYRWEYSRDNGATWNASSSTEFFATCTLSSASRDGWLYRCIVTDQNHNSVTSDTAKITVLPEITQQPKDAYGKLGDVLKFTVGATGNNLTYWWQYSKDGGRTWLTSSSQTATATCTLSSASRDGWLYRCIVTDARGVTLTSGTARVSVVSGPVITQQPKDASGTVGKVLKFTVAASGDGLTYQWQLSKDNGRTWTASSSKTATATCTLTSASRDGWLYRCIVKDQSGKTVTTETARVIVLPAITAQPKDASGKLGDVLKFTVSATGNGLTYQWQYSKDGGKTWLASSSRTTTATCTLSSAARDGWLYRCRITDARGTMLTTDTARVSVLR